MFDDTKPKIAVDEKRFKQVMFNIIDNAVDAMSPGMVLRVGTKIRDGYAAFDVIDSGQGICDEIKVKIFAPFFTTKPGGSGLGLSVSKKIVEDHGGFIEFESEAGGGAAFSVFFPSAGHKNI
jgi:signal transduction histidine kinase